MKISFKPSVVKQIKNLSEVERKKILKKLKILETEPFVGKQLKGEFSGYWSVRAWPYRVIYTIVKKELIIVRIAHRQSAYA